MLVIDAVPSWERFASRAGVRLVNGAPANAAVMLLVSWSAKVGVRRDTGTSKNGVRPRLVSRGVIVASQCGKNPPAAWQKQATYRRENGLSRLSPLPRHLATWIHADNGFFANSSNCDWKHCRTSCSRLDRSPLSAAWRPAMYSGFLAFSLVGSDSPANTGAISETTTK
jgi:hypothetical protein